MTRDSVAIGLDLGTSSLKAVAVTPDGTVLARFTAGYPTDRPGPGAAEQRPADWMTALETAVTAIAATVPPSRWSAIGLSAMIPTLVPADADGNPAGAAITWEDGRAEDQGTRLRDAIGGDDLYARTGQWVDGRYLLPVTARLREIGDRRGFAPWLLGAKDWLFGRLTGEFATDPSTATGFGCYDLATGSWDMTVAAGALSPGVLPSLPPVLPSTHAAPMLPSMARRLGIPAGIPVVLGAADSVLAARGLGVTSPGDAAYVAGTSTVIMGIAPGFVADPAHRYLVTPLEHPGPVGLEMDLVATGSAVRWLAGLLGLGQDGEATAWQLAASVAPGADGVVLLPYLGPGEQGALWDPTLRGTLIGATLAHGREHLARALLDGIVLESRRCLAVLEEVSGIRGAIVMTGPSIRSREVVVSLAEATGRTVRWPADPDHPASAWGAAALAFEAVGMPVPAGPVLAPGITPAPGTRAVWDALWERHEDVRIAVGGLPAPLAAPGVPAAPLAAAGLPSAAAPRPSAPTNRADGGTTA